MKKQKLYARLLVLILVVTSLIGFTLAGCSKKNNPGNIVGEDSVTILFTHDIHSHLDNLAKLKTVVDEKKSANPATILVDGGDIAMGTLYQTIYEKYAPDMLLLGRLGYDATTFGNHEFDYLPKGLANMLNSAVDISKKENVTLPKLVVSNIDWNKNTTDDNKLIKSAMENFGSKEYIIVERGGVRIGIYGVLGEEAAEDAPMSGLTFEGIVETSKKMVKTLKAENVDMIVCLSHSGTNADLKKSEDELLAQAVPEIDVIISAHSHTVIPKPIVYGNTTIVAAGCYAEYFGELELKKTDNGRWGYVNYELLDLNENIKEDKDIRAKLDEYKTLIGKEYLSKYGYTFDQVVAHNNVDFYSVDDMYAKRGENGLGNIISDAFMYAVHEAEGEDYIPVAMTIEPVGVVRDTFKKGNITISDVFNVSSLGIGKDGLTGYPLASVYLTGAEIKNVAEIDASVSILMNTAQLHPCGISWKYNNNRIILNRVTDIKLFDTSNGIPANYTEGVKLEDKKLYRVVSGLYSLQMLGAVKDKSFGLISIVPKDKDGNPVEDFYDCIIYNKDGSEIKEWVAIAKYLDSFEKKDGVSEIPASYASLDGRKIVSTSLNPIELFKNPNKIGIGLCVIIIVLIILVILLIKLLVKVVKKVIDKRRK